MDIRLSVKERRALKETLKDFSGKIFMFGSRVDMKKRGGDIDILLMPDGAQDPLALKRSLVQRFQREIEQSIDIVIFDVRKAFCREILKYAKPLNPASL